MRMLVLVHLSAELSQPLIVFHLREDCHGLLIILRPDVELDGLPRIVVLDEPLRLFSFDVGEVEFFLGIVVASDFDHSLGVIKPFQIEIKLSCLVGCVRFDVEVSCFLVLALVGHDLSFEKGLVEFALGLLLCV